MTVDTAFWLTCAAVALLLALSAFFSGSETALTAASRSKLKALADRGSRRAEVALQISGQSERMIGALLLGNHLVTVLAAALATAVLTRAFGAAGIALATLAITALVLIFGEVLPKTLAIIAPERVATGVALPVRAVIWLFAPVVSLVRHAVGLLLRPFGIRDDPDRQILALRDDIMGAITLGHSEGAVEKEDRDRLLGALDLSDRTVDAIMRHRSDVEMIDADQSPDAIISQVLASPHSRLPIYRGDADNILGVILAKDLLREVDRIMRGDGAIANLDVVKVAMKPYFIPDTTALDEQMREFLKRRTHFALVVDEYGALEGLITLEDILEEIVGEIHDETDVITPSSRMKRGPDGAFVVDGAMTIRDVNRATDWRLPDDEANTVAGLVIHEAQMIPEVGQQFSFHGFRFEVVGRRENRVTRLKIRPL